MDSVTNNNRDYDEERLHEQRMIKTENGVETTWPIKTWNPPHPDQENTFKQDNGTEMSQSSDE